MSGHGRSNILVYRTGSLGDTLVAMPALEAIRAFYGEDARISLLSDLSGWKEVGPADVLAATGLVDHFAQYVSPSGVLSGLRELGRLRKQVHSMRYDLLIYLGPSARTESQRRRDGLLFRAAGIPQILGLEADPLETIYPKAVNGLPAPVAPESDYLLQKLAMAGITAASERLGQSPRLPVPEDELLAARTWLEERRTLENTKLLAVAPGVNQPANQWPLARFESLLTALTVDGNVEPLLIGGPKDRNACEALIRACGVGINGAGVLTVREAGAAMANCDGFVGLDSGPMHLAAAVGVPCVAIFSARDNPGRWHPIGEQHTVIRTQPDCAGCHLSICDQPEHRCLLDVPVETVLQGVQTMLSEANDIQQDDVQGGKP